MSLHCTPYQGIPGNFGKPGHPGISGAPVSLSALS